MYPSHSALSALDQRSIDKFFSAGKRALISLGYTESRVAVHPACWYPQAGAGSSTSSSAASARRFIFVLHFGGFRHRFVLALRVESAALQDRFVALNFPAGAARFVPDSGDRSPLVIRFRTFGAVMFAPLTGHIDVSAAPPPVVLRDIVQFASRNANT